MYSRWRGRELAGFVLVKSMVQQEAFTLIEVLVTLVVVAIGLLGLGALQINTMNNSFETYQRALVASIVEDMAVRIRMNPSAAAAGEYFLEKPTSAICTDMQGSARDLCEWHSQIAGTSAAIETGSVSAQDSPVIRNVGAPLGARGCIDPLGTSASGEVWIRVSVAWIGVIHQAETVLGCGADEMGDESYRRVVFRDVAVR